MLGREDMRAKCKTYLYRYTLIEINLVYYGCWQSWYMGILALNILDSNVEGLPRSFNFEAGLVTFQQQQLVLFQYT